MLVASIFDLFTVILNLFNAAIPVLIGAALVLFLYGLLKYITAGDDAKGRSDAIGMIIWGIVALFVMVTVWGLVGILTGTFQLTAPTRMPGVLPGRTQ